jgi:putative cell wall-binding protein
VYRRHVAAALVILAILSGGGPAGAQEAGYQRTVDIGFPVSGRVWYQQDYHAWRSGNARRHQATDIFGDKLQALHAAVDGTVCYINGVTEPPPAWGYSLSVCGDDGLRYNYLHINNDSPGTDDGLGGSGWAYAPGLERGERVARGEWIAYMGDSGNAETTDPHLHFEIFDEAMQDPALAVAPYKQGRVDPFPSLQAAQARGDVPAEPDETPPAADGGGETDPVPEDQPLVRLAGSDRTGTALRLSGQRASARTVVVAPAGSPSEALVAGPLAGLVDGPVLLSLPDGLEDRVVAEIRRLGARNAYVVGSDAQLAERVEADLTRAGVTAQARLEAPDVFALSAVVAREMASYPSVGGSFARAFLARGSSDPAAPAWPDALSASAPAARLHVPVLLTPGDRLTPEVAAVLADLTPDRIDVVGGTAAVSEAAAAEAAEAAGGEVVRLAGPDRYGTSAVVAEAGRAMGLDGTVAFVATGRNFPDALAAGPAAARERAPVLLVDGQDTAGSPASVGWLDAAGLTGMVVVGGTAAVSEPVADALELLVDR